MVRTEKQSMDLRWFAGKPAFINLQAATLGRNATVPCRMLGVPAVRMCVTGTVWTDLAACSLLAPFEPSRAPKLTHIVGVVHGPAASAGRWRSHGVLSSAPICPRRVPGGRVGGVGLPPFQLRDNGARATVID